MYRRTHLAWLFTVVFLVGCGTKDAATDSAKGGSDATAKSTAKDDPSNSGTQKAQNAASVSKTKTADGTPLPALFAEDLKHAPSYAYLVAVMRPAKMFELAGVKDIPGADWAGANPVKPSEIERVVATVYPRGSYSFETRPQLATAFVIQLRQDVSRQEIVSWLSPKAEAFEGDDRIYVDPEWNDENLVLGFLDNQTILASRDPDFVFGRANIKDEPPHNLASAFAKLDPEAHAVAAVDVDKLGHFLRAFLPYKTEMLLDFLEPLRLAKSMRFSINLSKPDGFILHVENDETQDSEQLGKAAKEALAGHVEAAMATFKDILGDEFATRIQSVEQRLNALLESMSPHSDENAYTIESRQLPSAAETLQIVGEFGALHLAQLRVKQSDLRFGYHMTLAMLGVHNYHDTHRGFPRDIVSQDGKPLLSWRVAILPYVEQTRLYDHFHLDEPWNSEHNLKLMQEMPVVYQSRGKQEPFKTSIQQVTGAGTGGVAKNFEQIEGTAHTLALVESQQLVEWTRPGDFEFDPKDPANGLRVGGAFAAMYDGSRVYLAPDTDRATLRSAFLNGGSSFDVDLLRYKDTPVGRFTPDPEPVRLTDERLDELTSALKSGNETDVLDALRVLEQPRPSLLDPRSQSILDAVTPLLQSELPLVRSYALRAIRAWRVGATIDWKAVAKLLKDPYEANRWLAIEILSEFPKPELVRALVRLPVQDQAVFGRVLYENCASIAADAVVLLLKDPDFEVRARACYVIGGTGRDDHVALLQGMLKDDHEACREAANEGLEMLRQKGPLVLAVEEFDGDIAAALEKIAKDVELDDEGNVIAVDLTQFDTPFRLRRSDFPLFGKLSKLEGLRLTYARVKSEDLVYLKDLPLESLEINYCPRLDDTVADVLSNLKTLRILLIDKTKIGDNTATAIAQLDKLQELGVSSSLVSDAGLKEIGKLQNLVSLNLSGTRISDKGLAAIARHSNLQQLYLLDANITDASVEHLMTLKNLEFLNLSGSGVTAAGLARLREALPTCRVLGND